MGSLKPVVRVNPVKGNEIFERAVPYKTNMKALPTSSPVPPLDLSSLKLDENEDGNDSPTYVEVKVKTPSSMDSAIDITKVDESKAARGSEITRIFKKDENDELLEMMMKEWTNAPYTKLELKRLDDKNELEEKNKELRITEAVMTDQLCRSAISSSSQIFGSSQQAGGFRSLHNSRVNVSTCNTEGSLSQFVKFETRIFTDVGKDAMRDLTGFYFSVDGSLTIYELKTFGKSSKSLPFIKRDFYKHLRGPRTNEPYNLTDILEEGELEFRTANQPLPDSLLQQKSIKLIIGRVDVTAKKKILLQNVDQCKHNIAWNDLHCPKSKEEEKLLEIQHKIRAELKNQWKNMGIQHHIRVGHQFREILRENESNQLDLYASANVLSSMGITIPNKDFKDLVTQLSSYNITTMSYLEFLRYFLGEMSEERKKLIRKAFAKININKQGSSTAKELTTYFNAYSHPWVKSGFREGQEILQLFLGTFNDESIPYRLFEEFYEGLSLIIISNRDFENIIRNSWNI